MKPSRFIILLIAAVMLLGTVGAVSAAPTLVVEVPTEEVAVGETITVPVKMQDSLPFISFKIEVKNVEGADITVSTEEEEVDGEMTTVISGGLSLGSYAWNSDSDNAVVISYMRDKELTSKTPPLFSLDITVTANNILEVPVNLVITEYYNNTVNAPNMAPQVVVQDAVVKVARTPAVATSIDITAPTDSDSLAYGETGVATATVLDQYGEEMQNAQVTWSAEGGITIDAAGNYKVVNAGAGSATITASAGDISDEVSVSLTKAELKDRAFVVSGLGSHVWTGQPFAVTAEPKDTGVGKITVFYNGDSKAPSDRGTYTVTISVTAGDNYLAVENLYLGTLKITNTVIYAPTLGTFPTYNGKEQTIALVDSTNSAGKYTVSGNTGTDVGTYTLTLTLNKPDNAEWDKGGENGVLNLKWEILPKSLADAEITVGDVLTYTGKKQTQSFVVKLDGTTLVAGTDYTIEGDSATSAGEYKATITGMGNYAGYAKAAWTIAPQSLAEAEITAVTALTYTGAEQTQDFTVKLGEVTLAAGTDYTIEGASAVNAGEYTATVTGKGNYAGTLDAEWVIAPQSLEGAEVAKAAVLTYNGKEQVQAFTVKLGEVTLIADTDYTVTGANKTAAGEYTATITGKGNYAGTLDAEWAIEKALLTIDNLTITPELPVSYEIAQPVVVTVKEGIFGNGTLTVKYGTSEDLPTEAGIYKVNATFAEDGTNYTACEIYLGDMTIVKKIVPTLSLDFVVNPNNVTINGGYTIVAENTATIDAGSDVKLSITFADHETIGSSLVGNISAVVATYPDSIAASQNKGVFKYNLTINLGNKLTKILPNITSVYDPDVAKKVKPSGKTFTGLVMIGAENAADVNSAIESGKGDVTLTFKIPKTAVSAADKGKIVVYHVSGDNAEKAKSTPAKEEGDYYLVTVTGSGFSSYVAGIENDVSSGSTSGGSAGILIPSSSKTPTTVTPPEEPVEPETPTDVPGDVPSDIPGTTPSEPGKSPAPILGVLAALGAAVVLRRK